MIWIILAAAVILFSIYVLLRKNIAGIPLVIGLILLYAVLYVVGHQYPPSLGLIVASAFALGLAVAMIAWGLANYITEKHASESLVVEKHFERNADIYLEKPAKATYATMYGLLPWDEAGARYFSEFLNDTLWVKGYKVEFMDVALELVYGYPHVRIWGIVRPKTVIDRILY